MGYSWRVEVLQQRVEDVVLPEGPNSVDTTVSEWMCYFLIRESMLNLMLVARDRWLKRGGAMYPSHARILVAASASLCLLLAY